MVNTIVGTQRPDWLHDDKVHILVQSASNAPRAWATSVRHGLRQKRRQARAAHDFGWTIHGAAVPCAAWHQEDLAALIKTVRRDHARSGIPGRRSQATP